MISPLVKRRNAANLKSVGELSAEVQESLNNFKVIIAFNRRDYFRQKFEEANSENYRTPLKAGILNNIFLPVYSLASHLGQLVVLTMGIYLIIKGSFTIGVLISFLSYVNSFYGPLRSMATLWSGFQLAMAAWDRRLRISVLSCTRPKPWANAQDMRSSLHSGLTSVAHAEGAYAVLPISRRASARLTSR